MEVVPLSTTSDDLTTLILQSPRVTGFLSAALVILLIWWRKGTKPSGLQATKNLRKQGVVEWQTPISFPVWILYYFLKKVYGGEKLGVVAQEIHEFAVHYYRKFGLCGVRLPIFGEHILVFTPELAELILDKEDNGIEHAVLYSWFKPFLGDGLLASSAKIWKVRRKLIEPAFHYGVLQQYLVIMDKHGRALVDKLKTMTTEPFDVIPCMEGVVFDTIYDIWIGRWDHKEEVEAYKKAGIDIFRLLSRRLTSPLLWNDFMFSLSPMKRRLDKLRGEGGDHLFHVIMEDRKKYWADVQRKNAAAGKKNMTNDGDEDEEQLGIKKRYSIMDKLLKCHNQDGTLAVRDIVDEMHNIGGAAQATTTFILSWAIYLVGNHPEVQKRVIQEVDEVFEKDGDRASTMMDIRKLHYLRCVILETLRLYPPIGIMGRTIKKMISIEGYQVPVGAQVYVDIWYVHRDPKYFPNPEKFLPERFLAQTRSVSSEQMDRRHRFVYIPFARGPRNCVGQKYAMYQMLIILSSIFRNFEVKSLDPLATVPVSFEMAFEPAKPIQVQLTSRS